VTDQIGVIGAGAWGTTLAVRLGLHNGMPAADRDPAVIAKREEFLAKFQVRVAAAEQRPILERLTEYFLDSDGDLLDSEGTIVGVRRSESTTP
jgi:hypothetical protein